LGAAWLGWILASGSACGPSEPPQPSATPSAQEIPAQPDRADEIPTAEPLPNLPIEHAAAKAAHFEIQRHQLGEALAHSPLVQFEPMENPEGLSNFYAALRGLASGEKGAEKVRILVYGSSSTAGDRWTGYLRGYLQSRFGDGGPGFVAVVPLWRWHRHQEVKLDPSRGWESTHALLVKGNKHDRYGLMGVYGSTKLKGARLELDLKGLSETAERWSIWYLAGPNRGRFELSVGNTDPTTIDASAKELRPGYAELTAPANELRLRTLGGGEVRLFGVVIERDEPGVVIDTLGIGGSGARRMLDWEESLWAEHVRRRKPALFILAYGGIEAMRDNHDPDRWERELGQILDRFERAAPEASCLILAPQDVAFRTEGDMRERPANLDGIMAVQRKLAERHGCAFFDTPAMMGGPGSMPSWVEAELAKKDHVHFSKHGFAHMGRVLADALMLPYDARTSTN
jgi:hypothetical protein